MLPFYQVVGFMCDTGFDQLLAKLK